VSLPNSHTLSLLCVAPVRIDNSEAGDEVATLFSGSNTGTFGEPDIKKVVFLRRHGLFSLLGSVCDGKRIRGLAIDRCNPAFRKCAVR